MKLSQMLRESVTFLLPSGLQFLFIRMAPNDEQIDIECVPVAVYGYTGKVKELFTFSTVINGEWRAL